MNPQSAVPVVDRSAIARALYDDGKYREAIAEARRVREVESDARDVLQSLFIEASAWWELGESVECLACLDLAGPLIDGAESSLRGNFYGQRALHYRKFGEYDLAFVDYQSARDCFRDAGNREGEARVENNLAKVYSDLGRIDDAHKHSDNAIEIAEDLGETILAGRFYDMKAQNALDHKEYELALKASLKALSLLETHPTAGEALETHTSALRAAISEYLAANDPIETFSLRRVITNGLKTSLDAELIRVALKRCAGNVYQAADILNVKHPSLVEAIDNLEEKGHKMPRQPKRRRCKSLIKT